MHVVPVVSMTLEWLTNSIVFDVQKGAARSLWLITSFIPLTYFAKDIAGYDPYPDIINYNDANTYKWIAIVLASNQIIYYGIAYLTNFLKTGSGVSPAKFFESHVAIGV